MTAEAMPYFTTQVTVVFSPSRGRWGPGCEPGPVRDKACEYLAAETRAAGEQHQWIGAAMQDAGLLPGTESGDA